MTFSLIRSLIADRRILEASGCIFVEGIRNFITAVDHGWSVQTIVYSERLLIAPALHWPRKVLAINGDSGSRYRVAKQLLLQPHWH